MTKPEKRMPVRHWDFGFHSDFGFRPSGFPIGIHKLAHKGKKAACHSDNVEDAAEAKLVQVNTLKAHGVAVNETGL